MVIVYLQPNLIFLDIIFIQDSLGYVSVID